MNSTFSQTVDVINDIVEKNNPQTIDVINDNELFLYFPVEEAHVLMKHVNLLKKQDKKLLKVIAEELNA